MATVSPYGNCEPIQFAVLAAEQLHDLAGMTFDRILSSSWANLISKLPSCSNLKIPKNPTFWAVDCSYVLILLTGN